MNFVVPQTRAPKRRPQNFKKPCNNCMNIAQRNTRVMAPAIFVSPDTLIYIQFMSWELELARDAYTWTNGTRVCALLIRLTLQSTHENIRIKFYATLNEEPRKTYWILTFRAQRLLDVPSEWIFSNSTFCPHSVFMCFVWIWEQTAINSLYSINWLVCITQTECVYCAVRTEHLTFNNSTFCPHSVFMCFVWIWEQTAIISLYSINWLVCITESECLLRGTDRTFNIQQFYVLPTQCIYVFCVDLRTNSDYFPIQH
jgi:hypothetical protein